MSSEPLLTNRVTQLQALEALGRMKEKPTEEDAVILATFIAEHSSAPKDNTGLPCTYCGETQERLSIIREDDDFLVRVSTRATKKEMKDLQRILKVFEEG